MTIEAKLKKLVENEIKASTKVKLAEGLEDLENCSDAELIKYAKQMGLEDSIVLDGEGGLSNRDEVIQAINNVDASSNELEEDAEEVDEAPRKMSPAKAKAFLQSIDALGKDFFTLRSETVTKIVDYAREVGYRKSPSAPGSTGRMFFQYLSNLANKAPQGGEQEVDEGIKLFNSSTDLTKLTDKQLQDMFIHVKTKSNDAALLQKIRDERTKRKTKSSEVNESMDIKDAIFSVLHG